MTTNSSRKILGVDPGSRVTGYGIIITEGPRLDFVSCGTIRTKQGATFAQRLLEIYEGLTEVIERHQPQEAAVEEMFVARNPNTALKLGQARAWPYWRPCVPAFRCMIMRYESSNRQWSVTARPTKVRCNT